MNKFEFFGKFNDAVIIIDNTTKNVLYRNSAFKRNFSDFSDLKRFSHRLNFDVCALSGDNMEMYSPFYQAITSPQNFFARATYQSPKKNIFYFDINAIKRSRYIVIIFKDVTAERKMQNLKNEKSKLKKKYDDLFEEN